MAAVDNLIGVDDEELLQRAEAMAASTLGPMAQLGHVSAERIQAVQQSIYKRLLQQRDAQLAASCAPKMPAPVEETREERAAREGAEAEASAAAAREQAQVAAELEAATMTPEQQEARRALQVDGVELCGDEAWYADPIVRQRLHASVVEGHKEQKIIVGQPALEVERICPDGRTLAAGGVLRLGGAHLGGYGENDIAYAYRQLSRALHPDKNPNVPKAPEAFMRLKEAADELKQALKDQRLALHTAISAMDGTATEPMLERPQEALFAETTRLLIAICGVAGEEWVPEAAKQRMVASYLKSRMFHNSQPHALFEEWMNSARLLDLYGTPAVRTAYDCAPKRYRAQFLCLLFRVLLVEAKHNSGCVRASWAKIFETFPELSVWKEFRERIQHRVWDCSGDPPEVKPEPKPEPKKRRSMWDAKGPEEARARSRSRSPPIRRDESPETRRIIAKNPDTADKACKWAVKWRSAFAMVLPSAFDGAVAPWDAEAFVDLSKWHSVERPLVDRPLQCFQCGHVSLACLAVFCQRETSAAICTHSATVNKERHQLGKSACLLIIW
eukprot:TRINITY_DN14186_c0_g1_i1.p1 TRINITY_DN14186_c0_g1~~TRINITY_DN14186_c0_g1_i1.p1  ORF type:complete len:584 (+),score=115.04 TRINITY_DN14186_c0_g1_i1:80-1753(+)